MLKSFTSLFPLIDDPANFFYSKLKNLFLTATRIMAEVQQKDRTIYKVSLNIPHQFPITKRFDVRYWSENTDLLSLHPEQGKTYVYASLYLSKSLSCTQETTTSGEVIPVEEQRWNCQPNQNLHLEFRNIQNLSDEDRILVDLDNVDESPRVFFLLARLSYQNQQFSLVNCFPNEEAQTHFTYTPSFKGLYKPDIGRKWVINLSTPSTYLTYSWQLYSIDSDYNEVLIDSSELDTRLSATIMAQPSPFVERPVNLTFWDRSLYEDPTSSLPNTLEFHIYEQEYAPLLSNISPDTTAPIHLSLGQLSEYTLCTNHRHDLTHLKWLFSSFHVREYCERNRFGKKIHHKKHSFNLYKEEWVLALSYILGLDLRLFTYPWDNTLVYWYKAAEDEMTPFFEEDFYNGITQVLDSDITQSSQWETVMETQFNGITNISYQSYTDPQTQEVVGDLVPIVQNSLGFTKELFTTKYLLGYYRLVKDIRNALFTNSNFTPKGTNSKTVGEAIRQSSVRFIPTVVEDFFTGSVIGREDEE